jgi:hypothetical protein
LNMRQTTSPQPSLPLHGGEGEEIADFAGFRGSIRAIGFWGVLSLLRRGEGDEARDQAFDHHLESHRVWLSSACFVFTRDLFWACRETAVRQRGGKN